MTCTCQRLFSCLIVLAAVTRAGFAARARADIYYWEPLQNSSAGGSGTWDAATNAWAPDTSFSTWSGWPGAGNDADFYSGSGTVTVNNNQSVGNIIFDSGSSGYLLSGGTLTMDGGNVTVNATSGTIASCVAGSAGLSTAGAGTLYLTNAANSFTGGVTLAAGVLNFTTGALTTNNGQLNFSGGTLQWGTNTATDLSATINGGIANSGQVACLDTNGNNVTFANAIGGSGGLTKLGAGMLTLNNANTYSGPTVISAGTLGVATFGNTLSSSTAVTVNNGGALECLNDSPLGSGGAGSPLVTVNAGGTLLFSSAGAQGSGVTSWTPRLILDGGTLAAANYASGWGSWVFGSDVTVGGGTVSTISGEYMALNEPSGAVTFNVGPGSTLNVPGFFCICINQHNGSVGLIQAGSGLMVLSGANSYGGGTTISGGTLQIAGSGSLGGGSYSDALSIGSGATFVYNSSATQSLNGAVSGAGALTVAGPGALTLGSTTYTGPTTVNGGTLVLVTAGGAGLSDSSALVINNGATVTCNGYNEFGSGSYVPVTINAGGQLLRNSTVFGTRLGSLTLAGGTLGVLTCQSAGGSFWFDGPVNVTADSTISGRDMYFGDYSPTFSVAAGVTLNVTANFAGNAGYGLTMAGPGTMVLSNANTYSGDTAVSGGTLSIAGSGSLGGGSYSGALSIGSGAMFVYNSSATQSLNGAVSGAGALTVAGPGTLTLGSTTYTGPTTVNGGTLVLVTAGGAGLSDSSALVINNGATVTCNGYNEFGSGSYVPVTINAGGQLLRNSTVFGTRLGSLTLAGGTLGVLTCEGAGGSFWFDGPVNVTADSTISGRDMYFGDYSPTFSVAAGATLNVTANFAGNAGYGLTMAGPGTMVLSNANTYSGDTAVSGGTLAIAGSGSLGGGSYSGALSIGSGAMFVYNSSATQSLNGTVSGAGALTKIGNGTLVLSQQNTYSGPTTVSSGLLVLNSGGYATPSSGSICVNGGTLSVNQDNTWGDSTITSGPAVTVNAGGVMTNGSGYAFTLINPTLSGGTLVANGGEGPSWGSFGMKGTITVNGVQTSAINAGAGSNMFVNIGANSNPNGGDATFLVTSNASPGLVVNVPLADMGNGAGSNGLVKSGSGSMVLTALNTYSGDTTVNGGTLSIASGGALTNCGPVTVTDGVLVVSGSLTTASGQSFTVGGDTNSGTATINAGASVNIGNGGGVFVGNGPTGGVLTINGGTVNVGASGSFPNNWFRFNCGWSSALTSVLNLNGGVLSTQRCFTAWGPSPAQINFNGGVLQAAGDLSTIGSLFDDTAGGLAVYIDASGGTIDTQGYSVSCNKAIQHGSGSPTDGGLTKIGSGTLILSQQNTYTGPTTVSGGLLVLSSGGYATPSSGSIYVNGGTLSVNQENTWADSTITSGPAVTVNAGGVMTNGSGYAFTLINPTLSGGTLVANSGDGPTWGSFGMKGTITVNGVQTSAINAGAGSNMFVNIGANSNPNGGDATFLVTSNASPGLVVNVPLADMGNGAGSNGLVKSGSGSLVLTAANTYSGNTTVNGGTLSIGGGGLLGGGSYSGALAIGSGATFCYSSSATQTLGGAFSGAGNLVQMGAGVLTLTCNYNNSTCTGSVTVSGGTLVLGNDSAIANASALVINNGATVQTTYYNELGLTPPPVTINAGGQLLRNNSSNATRLGSLTLAGGTLGAMAYDTAGSAFWLQGDVNVTANSTISAVTNLVNPSQSFNVSAGATLNVTGNIISNSGYGLTLAGPGALTLAASACQYSGPTYVNGGTLGLSGAGSLAGTMFVAGGSSAANQGTLSLMDGALSTVSLANAGTGLTLGTSGGSAVINLDVGGGADCLALSGTLALNVPTLINLNELNATPVLGTYNILTYQAVTGSGMFQLGTSNLPSLYMATLSASGGTAEQVTIGYSQTLDAWWLGSSSGLTWSNTGNWALSSSGGAASMLPGSLSTVHFGAAAGTATVDASSAVATLDFTAGTSGTTYPVVISSGGGTLTIGGGITDNGQAPQTVTAPLTLGGPQTWAVNGTQPLTVTGIITGANTAGLTLSGTGTVILTAANTFAGGTTVSGGTLQLSNATSTGSVPAAFVAATGTLLFANGTPQTYAGSIAGGGALVVAGSAPLTLTAIYNAFSGATTVSGMLQLGDGTSANGGLGGTITNNGLVIFDNPYTQNFTTPIGGNGGVVASGSALLTLAVANDYSGGTTISGGTLRMGNAAALGNGGVLVSGGVLDFGDVTPTLTSLTLASGTLTASDGGAVMTAVTNTAGNAYIQGAGVLASTASLTMNDGLLTLGGAESISSLTLNGGTLAGSTLSVGAGGIAAQRGVVSTNLAGTGQLVKTTGNTVLLSGANSYSGGTSVGGGVLQLGSNSALPSTGSLTVNAGTLDLAGNSPTVGLLSGAAAGTIVSSTGPGTLTVNAAAATAYSGLLADGGNGGTLGVVKGGPGSLVLGGANTYSGGTTVSGGTLQLASPTALGSTSGALTVNSGTLDMNGQTATVGALNGSGTITSSASGATLTAGAGDATSSFGGVIVDGVGTTVALVKVGGGTLALGGANRYSGGTTISGGVLSISGSANLGSGNVTIGAATLQTSGNVVLDAARTVNLTDVASSINTPLFSDTATLSGPVTGTGALNKEGAGTLTLAAPSGDTYSGDTNVLAGTLVAAADDALSPASNLVIGDGASVILNFGGAGSSQAPPGLSPLPATVVAAVPALAPAGISTVPEPGTWALLLAGAISGLGMWYRRRK